MGFWEIGKTYFIVMKDGEKRTLTISEIDGSLLAGTDKFGKKRAVSKEEIRDCREIGDADGKTHA
jgi:hypothetical protein